MVNTFGMQHRHYTANDWTWSTEVQNAATNITQKLVSHWSNLHQMFSDQVRIDGVKVSQLGPDGRVVSEGYDNITDNALAGGYSGQAMPPECAWILGLWGYSPGSFTQDPGSKRGRMYLGGLSSSLQTNDGLVDQTISTGFLAAWQAFFNDVQGMHGGGAPGGQQDSDYWKVGIISNTKGTFTQLAQVTAEDSFGSQRRRQNNRKPVRVSRPIAHSE